MGSENTPTDNLEGNFRDLMSRFPTGVAIVCAPDSDGCPQGMTCSSLTSVCLDPPTLLVSLRTESLTQQAVARQLEFSVNVLGTQGRALAHLFSSPASDWFAKVNWEPSRRGLPWITDDVIAAADCRVIKCLPMGDHTVVFGQVLETDIDMEAHPLIYAQRRYSEWCPTCKPSNSRMVFGE
jgi:flavin reductase (NADH)